MRALRFFDKRPADVQEYYLDFGAWLYAISDTALEATSAVADRTPGAAPEDNMVIDSTTVVDTMVRLVCSGGVHGHVYKLSATMTSTGGLVKQEDVLVRVQEV